MESYKILQVSLHHVDFALDKSEPDSMKKEKAEEYIHSIINKSIYNENVRYFKVKRDSTEIIALINLYVKDINNSDKSDVAVTTESDSFLSINSISDRVANRLMEAEKKAQDKILKMKKEIKKGSLIQSVILSDEGKLVYILAKIDHVNILDKTDWEKHTGLPLEKEILKTCVITYNELVEVEDIKIFDSNKQISYYWSNELLELEPTTTDEDNTQKSFNEIDKFLTNNIKKQSPADYTLLYNSLLGYYNQNIGFDYDDMVEKVFENYVPVNKEIVNSDKLKAKIIKLPDKKFDKQFNIVPGTLRKKKPKVFGINPDIDLTLKDSIENLKDIISTEKHDNNDMFIKIKVDEKAYNQFNFSK